MPDASQVRAGATPHVRVFISYTHDSEAHKARVRALADRLRDDEVDAEIDRYVLGGPPQGWPAWMHEQIREADYVLVVCTAAYRRRAMGLEQPGVGRGAVWESLAISQALYEAQGKNERFIPVFFERADEAHVPDFLRQFQRYDLSDPSGYDDLYRHLTAQPAVPRPPLGKRRVLPPDATGGVTGDVAVGPRTPAVPTPLMLLRTEDAAFHFVPLVEVEQRESLRVALAPDSPASRTLLASWVGDRFARSRVDVAFHDTALRARVLEATRRSDALGDRFELVLAPQESQGGFMSEISTTGYSADDIATLRARRILLGERPSSSTRGGARIDMLESLITGYQRVLPLEDSPIRVLYARVRGSSLESRFEELACLVSTLWLMLTETVAHVEELTLRRLAPDQLSVRFRGTRRKYYTNAPATVIAFDGVCLLT